MNLQEFKKKYQKVPVQEFPSSVPDCPKVSVLVQTYNHAPYIRQCLDGILMQETDFDFEILLGEDASTDGTREICIEYAQKHPDKIRLFLHSRENNITINGRPSGRFNFCNNLFEANGEYIAFCEGDDYWIDEFKLQKQVDFLEKNPSFNLSVGRLKKRYQNTGELTEKRELNNKVFRKEGALDLGDYLTAGFSQLSTFVLRRIFLVIPEWFPTAATGDQAIVVIVSKNGKIKYHNQFLSVYRVHNGGVTNSVDYLSFREGNIELYQRFGIYTNNEYSKIINFRIQLYKIFALTLKYNKGFLNLFFRIVYYSLFKVGITLFNLFR